MVGRRRWEATIAVSLIDNANAPHRTDAIEADPFDDATVDVDQVGAPEAAIRERARASLLGACDGWRERGRCTAPDGSRIAHPHPRCLAAQYRYELILLENGVPR